MLAAALNFVIAIIISQTLGDTGSGTQSLVLATITFILIFSEIVCGASIIYLAPRHSFKKILVASVVWSALIAVFMGFSIRIFYPKLEPDLVVHVAILSFISSLSNINFRFLVGKEEIQKANYNTLLQPVLLTITLRGIRKPAQRQGQRLQIGIKRPVQIRLPQPDGAFCAVFQPSFKLLFIRQLYRKRSGGGLFSLGFIGRGHLGHQQQHRLGAIRPHCQCRRPHLLTKTHPRFEQNLPAHFGGGRCGAMPAARRVLRFRLRQGLRRNGPSHPHPRAGHPALLHFPHPRTLLFGHRALSDEHFCRHLRISRHFRMRIHLDTKIQRNRRGHHIGDFIYRERHFPVRVLRQGIAFQRSRFPPDQGRDTELYRRT